MKIRQIQVGVQMRNDNIHESYIHVYYSLVQTFLVQYIHIYITFRPFLSICPNMTRLATGEFRSKISNLATKIFHSDEFRYVFTPTNRDREAR